MVAEPAIPAQRNGIPTHPRLLFSSHAAYLPMIRYLPWSLATVSPPEKVFPTDVAGHYGCVLVPGQLTVSRQRKAIISLAFGRSAVLDSFLYFACFVLWLLLSSSECSTMPILPGPSLSWSCFCLSRSHCRLVPIAIPVNSRNLVHKSSYFDEPK